MNSGLRELKISAEINSMSYDFESLQQLQRETNKKSQRLWFYSASTIIFCCKKVTIHPARKRAIQYTLNIIQKSEMLIYRTDS